MNVFFSSFDHCKRVNYTVVQKCHPFSFHYSLYKYWPISIIFGTHDTELICNTAIIDLPTSSMYCCCTLGKFSFPKVVQHTVRVRRSSSCSMKLRNSFLRTYGLLIALILKIWLSNTGRDAESHVGTIRHQFGAWPIWDSAWLIFGMTYRKALWTVMLTNDAEWMKKEEILNTLL